MRSTVPRTLTTRSWTRVSVCSLRSGYLRAFHIPPDFDDTFVNPRVCVFTQIRVPSCVPHPPGLWWHVREPACLCVHSDQGTFVRSTSPRTLTTRSWTRVSVCSLRSGYTHEIHIPPDFDDTFVNPRVCVFTQIRVPSCVPHPPGLWRHVREPACLCVHSDQGTFVRSTSPRTLTTRSWTRVSVCSLRSGYLRAFHIPPDFDDTFVNPRVCVFTQIRVPSCVPHPPGLWRHVREPACLCVHSDQGTLMRSTFPRTLTTRSWTRVSVCSLRSGYTHEIHIPPDFNDTFVNPRVCVFTQIRVPSCVPHPPGLWRHVREPACLCVHSDQGTFVRSTSPRTLTTRSWTRVSVCSLRSGYLRAFHIPPDFDDTFVNPRVCVFTQIRVHSWDPHPPGLWRHVREPACLCVHSDQGTFVRSTSPRTLTTRSWTRVSVCSLRSGYLRAFHIPPDFDDTFVNPRVCVFTQIRVPSCVPHPPGLWRHVREPACLCVHSDQGTFVRSTSPRTLTTRSWTRVSVCSLRSGYTHEIHIPPDFNDTFVNPRVCVFTQIRVHSWDPHSPGL